MGFQVLLRFPTIAWRELTDRVIGRRRTAQMVPVRARGALNLARDTSRHRIYASRYEDLLK